MDKKDYPATQANDSGSPRNRMLSHTRQARILDHLTAKGEVTVAFLVSDLAVSDMTIRRDLVELEKEGWLVRIHGGAVLPESLPPVAMDREEPSFEARLRQRRDAKEAIAAAAAEIASRYRTIAIDVGTTTYLMAPHLQNLQHTRIFTNSVRLAAALGSGTAEVYLAGGRMRAEELAIGGPSAVSQFEALWFDAAVVGVSGITAEGFFDYSLEDAELKRVYLKRSGVKIVVCDSSKFQRMSLVHIAQFSEIDFLITDAEPPPQVAVALQASRVEVRIAPPLQPPGK